MSDWGRDLGGILVCEGPNLGHSFGDTWTGEHAVGDKVGVTEAEGCSYTTFASPPSAPRGRRGWKKFYAVLKGTILYLQKVRWRLLQSPHPESSSSAYPALPVVPNSGSSGQDWVLERS